MRPERIEPWTFLAAPTIELWETAERTWYWVMMDRPGPNEPGVILVDSSRHATPQLALAACDRVLDDWNRRARF